jgi:drug/metabolite transporter (DMT)-like permease
MDQQILPTNDSGWIWILGLGLISQVMGQGLIAKALALMPVGQSALLLLFAPVSTAVFSWLFIGEALPEGQFVSVMITLIGIAIVARR